MFYRSIAVGCELSLRPKKRTYKNKVRLKHLGTLGIFSTLAVVETLLDPQNRRLQWSDLSIRNVRLQGPELLVLSPSSLSCSLDGPKVCKLARNKKITCLR